MNLLGIHLTLLVGPAAVPLPAPPPLVRALQEVEVTHGGEGRSGFQLTFGAGRGGIADVVDYPVLSNPLLRPFNRVILVVSFNVIPRVLMDGIITHLQLDPTGENGSTTLTVTGEDLGVLMDLEEKTYESPAQPEPTIVGRLLMRYMMYRLAPVVIPPPRLDVPLPIERTPVFRGTDYAYCQELARRHGNVFYISPGPAPGSSTAYWGPPKRVDIPQAALSVNLGADSNVDSIHFEYSALEATTVSGQVRDAKLGVTLPVMTFASTRFPLASMPALITNLPWTRTTLPKEGQGSYIQAYARAQSLTDTSTDRVLTATGELNALRYGSLLQARGVVGLRGAGFQHDGFYYVRSVTHSIKRGDFKQRFTLEREGMGATSPVVPTL